VGRYYISVNRNIFNTELLKDEIDSILMNIMVNSSGKKNISKKINISKKNKYILRKNNIILKKG